MAKRTFLAAVWWTLLLARCCCVASDASGNGSRPSSHDEHGHRGGGVHLASWRWGDYGSAIVVSVTFIVAGVLKVVFHNVPNPFPESCVLILVGLLIGVVAYHGLEAHAHHLPAFTHTLFFNVLLPPIILDAAYALYDRDFLSNIGSVINFAVVGTLLNVALVGGCLYGAFRLGLMGDFSQPLTLLNCFVFSSLISAVDPVAVLAIFDEVGVNMGLYFLVFGESLLNDGVTVVLYNTMVTLSAQPSVDSMQVLMAFASFFTVVFGGLFIGAFVGMFSAFILKFTKHTRVIEPLILLSTSYLAYVLAECVHWSGIISLIGCGIAQKRYAFPNISRKTYTTVKYGVKTLAAVSDCIIFLYLGIVMFSHTLEWHTGFVIWTVALCLVVRFLGVFSLSAFVNRHRIKKISIKEQFIMAYGGLRGAVGFSLVTLLPDSDPFKDIFLTTTLVMIFFTVFIQGGTIKLLVNKLNISRKHKGKKLLSQDVNEKTMDLVMAGVASVAGKRSRYRLLECIRRFDRESAKKVLIRSDAEDLLALRCQRISLDEHYARLYGPTIMVTELSKNVTEPDAAVKDSKEEMKKLRVALSNTPFERFMKNNYSQESPKALDDILRNEYDSKSRELIRSLSKRREQRSRERQSVPAQSGDDEATSSPIKLYEDAFELNANEIRKEYLNAKCSFKSAAQSVMKVENEAKRED